MTGKHDGGSDLFSGGNGQSSPHQDFDKLHASGISKNPEYQMMDDLNDPSNFGAVDIDKPFFDNDIKSSSKYQGSSSLTKNMDSAPKSHYSKS